MSAPKAQRVILSPGLPPERHADRVIGEMLRLLAQQRAHIPAAIGRIVAASKDGTVSAQQRLAQRIRQAGAVQVDLKPGTRGRYRLLFYELCGWDPGRDAEIKQGDPLPARPQLAMIVTVIEDRGRSRQSRAMMFFSHHAIVRLAMRFGVRTMDEIVTSSRVIWDATWRAVMAAELSPDEVFEPPASGRRIRVSKDMVAVLEKHEKRTALIVVTVVFDRADESEEEKPNPAGDRSSAG